MNKIIKHQDHVETQAIDPDEDIVEIGQWYWFKGEKAKWLGCITLVGSNFVKLESPHTKHGWHSQRILLEEFDDYCQLELNAKEYIESQIAYYRTEVNKKMGEVQAITARLGVGPRVGITKKPDQDESHTYALARLNSQDNIHEHKQALIKAEKEDLPRLFEEIEKNNDRLACWMSAETLPLLATAKSMKSVIEQVTDRIFSVELYAGLTEKVVQIADGDPANLSDKLHVMQRRCYMDEECLVNYQVGGIDIRSIDAFDKWLANPEHMCRILPFPRCIVAFKVRRTEKERKGDGTLRTALINISLHQEDESTFLYIRNGDQLFRMTTQLEFGSSIFPDADEFHTGERVWARMFCSRVTEIIPERTYEDMCREEEKIQQLAKEWTEANPDKSWGFNPHRSKHWNLHDYEPFDASSVYYDEIQGEIAKRIKQYNRIALIIQGLLDRSPVLHPHPPAQTWTQEGFEAIVKLVYDGRMTFHDGPPPDFEAYRKRLNASLEEGCMTIGQEDFWERAEAVKENRRRDNDWRDNGSYRPDKYTPYGNPGPGRIARIKKWQPRARKALFVWNRKRQTVTKWGPHNYGDPIPTKITVPADKLLNIDAYTPGDFKQFYNDPRTRAQYLKWAPMLLAAEEYHAGNLSAENE